ncbi:hypothetical protein [Phytohabitans kaempferiae]|uniref:Uncharacterized protein n=1 Tax=Phytohabitans kaempferiae TaxID=1620943 RepID=A0ABV6M867_9ACTN
MNAVEYRHLVEALAAAASRRDAELAAAERSYQDGAAAVTAALARADSAADEADRRATAAAGMVIEVDREAARLWDGLRRAGGWWSRRVGELPLPAAEADLVTAGQPATRGGRTALGAGEAPLGAGRAALGASEATLGAGRAALGAGRAALPAGREAPPHTGDRSGGDTGREPSPTARRDAVVGAGAEAVALLDSAAKRIDQMRRGAPRAPLPRWLLPLLPPLGAVAATMTGLVAGGLVTLAHFESGLTWPLRLLGWLTFLIAPFTGVPPAALWVGRQFGSRLDTGAIGLIVLGGMAAGCGLSLLFAR